MSAIKKAIPNLLTLANLACGVLGIVWLFKGEIETACYLIWIAAVFDFFDGFVARLLKVTSAIGQQLDSLADLVTFGVLPSLIYFNLLETALPTQWAYLTLLTALLSALRLAKFNIDEDQQTEFKGLTTTANGLLTSSIPFILVSDSFLAPVFLNSWFLLAFCLFFSLMLVAPATLFSLKFKDFRWQGNERRFILIGSSILLLIFFRQTAIPLIIILYLILSFVVKNDKKLPN